MKVYGLSLMFILLYSTAFTQSTVAKVETQPDSVKIKSDLKDLEKIRVQLSDRIQKLRTACREDSIGIVNLKGKRRDVNEQSDVLKVGITDLENKKSKTREQRKLLKDLKQGHTDIAAKLVAMDKELDDIEINYKASVDLLANAEKMSKDLALQIKELRRLLNP
jgi:chromosome segregation ATPase